MRYTKQIGNYDCSVVAIVNATKWAGKRLSYRKHKDYFEDLYDPMYGLVAVRTLDKFLYTHRHLPFKVQKFIHKVNIKDLKDNITPITACILLVNNIDIYHTCLITKVTNNYIFVVNWDKKKVVKKISINKFKKYLHNNALGYIIERL